MAKDDAQADDVRAKSIGRPRRLTLGAVVEAASEIGLENLNMNALAARLGVGVATLYTYVQNRDELLRLVAAHRAWRPHLVDANQHWSEIVRAHADGVFRLFSAEPSLLVQLVSGALGPEEEFDELENFVALLSVRGFTPEAAFALFRTASQLAVGAAVAGVRTLNWHKRGDEPRRVKLARTLVEREPGALPFLRQLGATYSDEAALSRFDEALTQLLKQVAAERGEALPPAAFPAEAFSTSAPPPEPVSSQPRAAPAKRRRKS
jgi:AcrR family transcriptional regulator